MLNKYGWALHSDPICIYPYFTNSVHFFVFIFLLLLHVGIGLNYACSVDAVSHTGFNRKHHLLPYISKHKLDIGFYGLVTKLWCLFFLENFMQNLIYHFLMSICHRTNHIYFEERIWNNGSILLNPCLAHSLVWTKAAKQKQFEK